MDKNKGERKSLVKFICVLLSLGLWLYVTNIENPIKTNSVSSIPVEVVNEEQLYKNNIVISPNQRFTVDITVEGKANDVYRASKDDFKVVADLGAYALKRGENIIPVQIIASPDNINIKANNFLGIKVNVEELKSKDFTLTSKVKVFLKEGMYQSDAVILPQTVKVEGAGSVIDRIASLSLVGEIKDVSTDFKKTFPIKALDSLGNTIDDVRISQQEGSYDVKVSEGKKVPIKVKNIGVLKEGLILDGIDLSKTTVEIAGAKDTIKTINSIETEVVDISNITETKSINIKVILPKGVKIVDGNEYVSVTVKVSKDPGKETIAKEIELPTKFIGVGDKNKVDSTNINIKIKVTGIASVINQLTAEDFVSQIDVTGKVVGEYEDIPKVTLINPNSNIKIDIISKIKYTISVK